MHIEVVDSYTQGRIGLVPHYNKWLSAGENLALRAGRSLVLFFLQKGTDTQIEEHDNKSVILLGEQVPALARVLRLVYIEKRKSLNIYIYIYI